MNKKLEYFDLVINNILDIIIIINALQQHGFVWLSQAICPYQQLHLGNPLNGNQS